jgi:hypothetical protein
MLKKDFIPRKDSDFLSWTTNFLSYLFSIMMRILFPNEVYQELLALCDDFAQKLKAAEEPSTRTRRLRSNLKGTSAAKPCTSACAGKTPAARKAPGAKSKVR